MRSQPGLGAAALALVLCACPGSHRHAPAAPAPRVEAEEPGEGTDVAGVVHVVRRGQTLYRIARTYGVDPADLMDTNGITDPRALEVGQELFIPGATRVLDVEVLGVEPAEPAPRPPAPAPHRAAPAVQPPPAAPSPGREPAATTPASLDLPPLSWPLKGVLYARYGKRGHAHHDGIDIAAPEGSTVLAAGDGEVVFVGRQSGYGKVVIVRHERGLVTVYAHNSAVLVREGERVARGQAIAKVGQTGRTTGPHLHFEVRQGVKPVDPAKYLR